MLNKLANTNKKHQPSSTQMLGIFPHKGIVPAYYTR